ncbi:c-type cytochrome [Aliiroseovarius crassostreae]|uniref:di-heme oxidoreductase family protein n=1 Tax=Aliiroseovarius crassostreae TaxID=154981 RepID=UPI0021B08239|nr:di-heme oxidoredictase family protein [Aliiroseovarius crassostreae]UWP92715.1 c-type cytochrome [Aliiroseovarius crassostreae]
MLCRPLHLAALCLALSPFAASADVSTAFGDPHLKHLPLTAAQKAKRAAALRWAEDFTTPETFEALPGGISTQLVPSDRPPFSTPAPKLSAEARLDFSLGEALFEKLWVVGPSSTISSDGLGPLYNARACSACHQRDGRGMPPKDAMDPTPGLVLRLSVPGAEENAPFRPHPIYGAQLQDRAITGHAAEGKLQLRHTTTPVLLAGGEVVELRRPDYEITQLAHGAPGEALMTSPRVAPQMIGLGLLEAIPEADILALADPEDRDGDGISGKAQKVWSREYDQWMLGRFGHKAGNPTLRQQSADAANGDIGLSSPLFPKAWGDCTDAQTACRAERDGNSPSQGNVELGAQALDLLTHYTANLAVPARRAPDAPEVLRGKALFYTSGCAACHNPKFVTHPLDGDPTRSFQLIWPYSDLLLHDMGEGLADHRPEGQATGREWRTPPLWGIGLTRQVSGREAYLHDGRARSLLEAILWHGGEAEAARNRVQQMTRSDRNDLISFVRSL